jgi:hypothetical protein
MPSTLRTASLWVIGARLETRSESALLLEPGRALQRVRGSPGEGAEAGYGRMAAQYLSSFRVANQGVEVPHGKEDEAGR